MMTEADTCRKYVLPKLYVASWTDDQISEQKTFTDGRIVVAGNKISRRPQKRAAYLLRYTRDFMIAVIEAKAAYKNAGDGLQQAKVDTLKRLQAETAVELDAMLPSILDKAFKGEL